ncbi:MAG: DUF4270 family protein, partial [Bacteroidota bacterium]
MLLKKNKLLLFVCAAVLLCFFSGCAKQTVEFGSDGADGDPNIVMIDSFSVDLSTLQVDSFSTSSSDHFIVGSHNDAQLGYVGAKSYFQITAPSLDLRGCSNCMFDSIDLRLKLSSGYMGDTSVPFTINIYEVTQPIDSNENSVGYNVSSLTHSSTPLVSKTFMIKPSVKKEISIRLPDEFGKNLFRMFKTNSDTVTNNDRFKTFVKGFCLETAASNNAIFYFDKTAGDSIMQLHYTEAAATPVSKLNCFTISSLDAQFNSFSYDKTGTALVAFTPKIKQLITSSLTNGISYLHHNSGLYPKIQFSNLYNIKELHPYVQVLRAILEIKPVSGTYGSNTFYQLPSLLELRVTDDDNGINGGALAITSGTSYYTQTGSLYIDNLYGENTAYTYDVTNFVNAVISEGAFSRMALLAYPSSESMNATDQRLLIGNNHAGASVKLKLYILGL